MILPSFLTHKMMAEIIPGVPEQIEGGFHDTKSEKCFDSVNEANMNFAILKNRFLDINAWHNYSGEFTAEFKVFNRNSVAKKSEPEVGDLVRIDIPGMGSKVGDGYDWVRITKIDHKPYNMDERCFIQCVPSINPTSEMVDEVAHFYLDKATSNFIVSKLGNCISAGIYGRNEVSNYEIHNLPDKLRNALISIGGKVGLSKIQWKALANGLLDF